MKIPRALRVASLQALRSASAVPESMRIVVYGVPAPQGSKRFVGVVNGRGHMVESSKAVAPWRQSVKWAALTVRNGAEPMDGPLRITMTFTVPKPKSAPKSRRTWPATKPDLSKLMRSTEDALVEAGAIADDARIIEARLSKVYPHEGEGSLEIPGAIIVIESVQ